MVLSQSKISFWAHKESVLKNISILQVPYPELYTSGIKLFDISKYNLNYSNKSRLSTQYPAIHIISKTSTQNNVLWNKSPYQQSIYIFKCHSAEITTQTYFSPHFSEIIKYYKAQKCLRRAKIHSLLQRALEVQKCHPGW